MADEIHVNREQEAGVRGGAASAAYGRAGEYAQPVERGMLLKDRVRWASVWGGLVVAFALQIWLTAIGLALFARGLNNAPAGTGSTLAIWAGIAWLISLFIGGLLASRLAGIAGRDNGLWNGIVLWGLAFTLLTILASAGAGGALGTLFGAGATAPTPTPGQANMALGALTSGAWMLVLFQFLSLVAAAAGGVAGARHVDIDTVEEH
jgi:hypothetical protein